MELNLAPQKNVPLKVAAYAFLLSMYLRTLMSNTFVDLDLWHQMALIRESIRLGYIPLNDLFAYTPTVFPSVQHEWGAGAVAYFITGQLDAPGVLVIKYLLGVIIIVFCWLCIRRRSVSTEIILFLAPIGIGLISVGFATVRAQMYSFAFVACLLWVFELDAPGNRKWLAALIPLCISWINLHAGFLVGIGFLGVFWLERLSQGKPHIHLILLVLVIVGLIAINPYGFSYYSYLWHAITMPRQYIREWCPIWKGLDLFPLTPFLISLVLLIYSVRKIGIRNASRLPILLTATLASVFSIRFVVFYGIVWLSYVPGYFKKTPLADILVSLCKRYSKYLTFVLCIISVGIIVRTLSFHPWKLIVPGDHIERYGEHMIYPVGAVEYLAKNSFKGNIMVYFDWGSYVTWKLYPNVRVSMDSRYEVAYPGWLVEENIQFYNGKNGWETILTKYPTDLLMLEKTFPLAKVMGQSKWKKVYTDNRFELYARPDLPLPAEDWTDRVFEGTFP